MASNFSMLTAQLEAEETLIFFVVFLEICLAIYLHRLHNLTDAVWSKSLLGIFSHSVAHFFFGKILSAKNLNFLC